MRHRLIILLVFIAFGIVMFVHERSLNAQQRRVRQNRRARTIVRQTSKYANFLHAPSHHSRLKCSSCHRVSTVRWRQPDDDMDLEDYPRGYPDIVDYPDHDSCVRCHRLQFFTSPRPVICTICHTKVSPRDDARFAFRKPNGARQFAIKFPHDKHQDVIALDQRGRENDSELRIIHASLASPSTRATDEQKKQYYACSICHETNKREPKAPRGGWPDAFVPKAEIFKSVPRSHASCFDCHWKSQKPTSDDCAGCHVTPNLPTRWGERISARFTHEREQHVKECTACHINITKASTLRGLKPDVPIVTCAECHNKQGQRLDIEEELDKRDKNRGFNCAYCHTSDKGLLAAPASHYVVAGRQPPQP